MLKNLKFDCSGGECSLRSVCVKECPEKAESPVECQGWAANATAGREEFDAKVCTELFQKTAPKAGSHVGYGSEPLFGIFCLPDIDSLPKDLISDTDLHNLVGEFGLDDI